MELKTKNEKAYQVEVRRFLTYATEQIVNHYGGKKNIGPNKGKRTLKTMER